MCTHLCVAYEEPIKAQECNLYLGDDDRNLILKIKNEKCINTKGYIYFPSFSLIIHALLLFLLLILNESFNKASQMDNPTRPQD